MEFLARGLTRSLKGKVLYQGLDLDLKAGCKIVVRGPSGAGKSQLLRQLAGLDANGFGGLLESGTLSLDGRSFDQWGAFPWRKQVSCVPQQVPRLAGSPADFAVRMESLKVQHGTRARDSELLARDLGLELNHWQQPWSELSVGERQRALLAIFIAREPCVLLLDEPTAALDPDSTRAVEDALQDFACVWVTHHEAQQQRIADHVIQLGGDSNAD